MLIKLQIFRLYKLFTPRFLVYLVPDRSSHAPSDWRGHVYEHLSSGLSTYVKGGLSLGFIFRDLSWSHIFLSHWEGKKWHHSQVCNYTAASLIYHKQWLPRVFRGKQHETLHDVPPFNPSHTELQFYFYIVRNVFI